jgi:hypothetical protein
VKDVNLVLREKELDIVRVRKEIEALHMGIPLLAEDRDWVEHGMAWPFPSLASQRDWNYWPPRCSGLDERPQASPGTPRDGSFFNLKTLVSRRASRTERWPRSGRPRGDNGVLCPLVEMPAARRILRRASYA